MLSSNNEIFQTSDESSSSSSISIDQIKYSPIENDRVNALKNLQISYNKIECQYFKSLYELEYKFHQQCSYLFEKRSQIINGAYEPNDDECQLTTDFIDTIENLSLSNNQLGIPSFWLQTLKQVPIITDMIEEWDEPILKYLDDIKLRLQIEPILGFTLEFHFNHQARKYFSNDVLTKFYEIQIEPDEKDLLFYDGTTIIRSIGCQIDWIDLTTNITRNQETGLPQSSFFQFFTSSSEITDDWKLEIDFQIGHYLRENLIPKAILYYTGEIFDDDDDYEYSDDDGEENNSFREEIGEGEH